MRSIALTAVAAAFLGGCIVVDEREAPPPPPRHSTTVVYTSTWHDTRYVLWREYYDCDDDEIAYCDSLGYDDDDLLVLLYISRHRRVPIRTVAFEYNRCGHDLFSVGVVFQFPIEAFLVDVVQSDYCPPPYGRAYGHYWKHERGYRLDNNEVRALIHLHIGVEYYGYKPHEYIREHEKNGFRTVAVREYPRGGSGGKNIHAAPVKKADRPWEAPDRKDWEQRRRQERERAVKKPEEPAKPEPPKEIEKQDEPPQREEVKKPSKKAPAKKAEPKKSKEMKKGEDTDEEEDSSAEKREETKKAPAKKKTATKKK